MALVKCEECGKEISSKALTCPHCGCPIKGVVGNTFYVVFQEFLDTDTAAMAGLDVVLNCSDEEIEEIINSYPCCVAEFSSFNEANKCALRLGEWHIATYILDEADNCYDVDTSMVYCPKCYSTNVQIVPRKWSILAGVLTNKVDRVCIKCKHKW